MVVVVAIGMGGVKQARRVSAELGERERGPGVRTAVLAGRVRIGFAAMGLASQVLVPALASLLPALAAYAVVALVFQWMISRDRMPGMARVFVMGLCDLSFVTLLVQRMGSVSTVLPVIYVVTPVLYATTTSRRRISVLLTTAAVALYAAVVVLELVGVLPYAPLGSAAPPSTGTALATIGLVAGSAFATTILTARWIRALGRANLRLRDLSQQDELTGLYNRRYLMERLEGELARIARGDGLLTVALVDLDGFKRVNDELGHDAGDAVLRAVARALLEATRKADVVARYGGDEFVVLLPSTDAEGARAVGARMLDHARQAARQVCPEIPVTASIGATACQPGDTPLDVIKRVDERLYDAKHEGGDRLR